MRAVPTFLTTVALCLGLTACTSGSGSPAPTTYIKPWTPPPTQRVLSQSPTLPRVQLGRPLWTTKSLGMEMRRIEFAGSVALVEGFDTRAENFLYGLDAATGKVRWKIADLQKNTTTGPALSLGDFAVAGSGRDAVLLMEYWGFDCHGLPCGDRRTGVAAIGVIDGKVRWTHPFGDDIDDDFVEFTAAIPTGATGAVAPIAWGPRDAVQGEAAVAGHPTATYGLDLRTGKTLWTRPSFVPLTVADNVVVGRKTPAGNGDAGFDTGVPVALDVADGHQIWSGDETQRDSGPPTVLGTTLYYNPIDAPKAVALRTGKVLRDLTPIGDPVDNYLGTPARAPFVATIQSDHDGPPRLLSWGESDGALPSVGAHPLPKGACGAAPTAAGYVIVGVCTQSGITTGLYDRSGNPLSDSVPGQLTSFSDSYAATYADKNTVAVYALP